MPHIYGRQIPPDSSSTQLVQYLAAGAEVTDVAHAHDAPRRAAGADRLPPLDGAGLAARPLGDAALLRRSASAIPVPHPLARRLAADLEGPGDRRPSSS